MNVALPARWIRLLAVALAAALALSFLYVTPSQAHEGEHGDAHVLIFTETDAGPWHDDAIEYGVPVLQDAFADAGITSEATNDSSIFTDEDLAHFDALVVFQANGDPWTAEEKAAMERYQQDGGGIVAIHNATDMRGGYQWWDDLIGALMPGHADNSPPLGLEATIQVEDDTHPATAHLEDFEWVRQDEWYNYSVNVRGDAHVLLTMDESTYNPGGNAMGYDHPISWCKPYDGGRAFVTGLGHYPEHYDEPDLIQHIVGGVQWAAGVAEGDCGGTKWDQFERVALDQNTSAPFGLDVAPDGRVFFTELVRGQIRVFHPETETTSTAITIPVYAGGEDGLLGIALDPDFEENGHLFLYHSPASSDDTDPENFFNRLSRFTVGENSQIDPASEVVMLEVPARRQPDEPGHTGGGLEFGPDGNLFLSVGDDVNPHSEPSGGYAPLSEREGTFHDARATSANTNDLRGKLLRITPEPDGTYSIPDGNMFAPGTENTRPEIYAMGFRNPFRFTVDPETGWVGLADYAPDNSSDNANRGPAGIVEWNLLKEPGFYGWPLCIGPNEPYRDVDYTTEPVTVGDYFDCDNPVNDSTRNTGLTELPAAQEPEMHYGYQTSSVPEVIPAGGGLAPMGGPFYDFDPELESETKFPEYYDGKPFFYEWSKNEMYSLILDDDGGLGKANPFLPGENWMAPIDSTFGPDGSLYVMDWGGGFGRDNPDSGLYRVDYVSGSRSPTARATATPDSGHAPLTVEFSDDGSSDPEDGALTYEWDFDGDGTADETGESAAYTYTENGVYDARLTVTDPDGKTGTTTVPITVGNTRPEVDFDLPPDGAFFNFGDEVSWDLSVQDAEDEEIDDSDVIIQPALGHDDHPHPADPLSGRTGSVETALGGGHSEDMNVFYILTGRYTDGGAGDIPSLSGEDTSLLFPKLREAEFFSDSQDVTVAGSRDIEGHGTSIAGQDGAWAAYEPVNLLNVDALILRASAATEGTIELRRDAPDGELLGTATVPATTGGRYVDVPVEVSDPGDTFTLYAVFPDAGERRLNFIEADGKGVSPTTKPKVSITSPTADDDLEPGEIEITAEAGDAENTITEVEFFVDGESIGADDTAPYAVTWDVAEEQRYQLTAVATNDQGASTTSRIVQVEVGDLFGDWLTYSNADGTFDRPDTDTWVIDSGGGNMWQGTDEYSAAYLPAAAAEQWTATVKIESQTNSHNSAKAGLIVRNDVTQPASSPGYAAMTLRAGSGFEWLRDTDGNGQLDASDGASTTSYPAWLRLVRDGEEYTAYWSKDDENYTAMGDSVTLSEAAAVQDIGLAVTAHSTTARSEVEFTDFTLTDEVWVPDDDPDPDPGPECPDDDPDGGEREPSDEFDGAALDGCRWDSVVRYDSSAVSVAEGELRIQTQPGDINGTDNGDPNNFILQSVPEDEDWTIETRLTPEMLHQWQLAGLMVYGDDDNYVKLDVVAQNPAGSATELGAELVSERDAQFGNGGNRQLDVAEATESGWYYLRLTKSGDTYAGEISGDGVNWESLGDPVTNDAEMTSFGLMAIGPEQEETVTVAFDYFRLADDEEDTTPPALEAEVDPAEADGDNGWYVTPPTVTVTATDDSGGDVAIETRTGDGEWEAYDGPVEVIDDGVHELEFRGTDDAGNVSDPVAVDVSLDATAPEVQVEGIDDGGAYDFGTELQLEAVAEDATSGVASLTVELDGEAIDNPATVTPAAGEHELTVLSGDEAGNVTEVTVSFVVEATYAGAQQFLDTLHEEGLLQRPDYNRLRTQLKIAERAAGRDDASGAEAALDRFVSFAENVDDPEVSAQLIALAEALRQLL
ncbi:ThuA domain-containing protein [Phytoactinopolyspora endophytica]|uniref:ThuA domain-containing protein n=1 Tax=Phytoactinopolyspora endophytica TaxID=1642495 RepID=UPI00101C84E9|nr:ThuA domain-containing protein [Phytoactinopolyspora endophytica]